MSNDNQPKTREEWFTLVDEHATSGLSQTEFCKQRNLIHCRFSYYKAQRTQTQAKGLFSQVKVNQEIPASGNIKIDLPNGFSCHVPSTISAEKLKSIISALVLC
jgi:hypothetical protein